MNKELKTAFEELIKVEVLSPEEWERQKFMIKTKGEVIVHFANLFEFFIVLIKALSSIFPQQTKKS